MEQREKEKCFLLTTHWCRSRLCGSSSSLKLAILQLQVHHFCFYTVKAETHVKFTNYCFWLSCVALIVGDATLLVEMVEW